MVATNDWVGRLAAIVRVSRDSAGGMEGYPPVAGMDDYFFFASCGNYSRV
jgi:hypothetical protein